MAAPTTPWDAEDWRMFFAERAAIYEFDGGMSREDAETAAWQSCRVRAMTEIAKIQPIVGNPTPDQLVALMAGRIRAADELLDGVFRELRGVA